MGNQVRLGTKRSTSIPGVSGVGRGFDTVIYIPYNGMVKPGFIEFTSLSNVYRTRSKVRENVWLVDWKIKKPGGIYQNISK